MRKTADKNYYRQATAYLQIYAVVANLVDVWQGTTSVGTQRLTDM